MSLDVRQKTGTLYHPVFLKILEDIPGGVTFATKRVPSGTKEIKKGTLLVESGNTTGLYQFIKTGKSLLQQKKIATGFRIERGSEFKVGEAVIFEGHGTASTITRVTNSTNTTWIGVNAALGGTISTTARLEEVAAVGATARKYKPSCILKNTIQVREDDLTTLNNVLASVVVRGTVDESMLPYYITSVHKTQLTVRFRFA